MFGTNIGSAPDGGVITGSALAMGLLFGLIAMVAAVLVTKFALGITGFPGGRNFHGTPFVEAIGWVLGSTLVAFLIGGIMGDWYL